MRPVKFARPRPREKNTARLQYPGGFDAQGNARNLTARARFLLEEFPPRNQPGAARPLFPEDHNVSETG